MQSDEQQNKKIEEVADKYRSSAQEAVLIAARFLIVFCIIFFMAVTFVHGRSYFVKSAYKVAKTVSKVVPIIPIKDKYTFLLLGTDMLIDVNRTDSIIMVFLSVPDLRIDLLSIPRDLRVKTEEHGFQKINAVYTFEYIKTKSDTESIKKIGQKVSQITGASIDYFVKVDLSGFEKIVDLFGGVEIDVEKNMTYDDNKQNLHIRLKKGRQVLNGKQALQYCRFRHDRLGDIGRMRRQQTFIKAMVAKAKEGKTLIRLPDIISGAMRFVSTDIDIKMLLALIGAFPEPSKITVHSQAVPGDYEYIENICYFKAIDDKMKKLVGDIQSGEIIKIEEEKRKAELEKAAGAEKKEVKKNN
ncbi:MAG TPA: LCP family protein [Candidatus Wallbacteria bacterium]|nr:LCP family protein [Candidatus Wallbacteria bacterium]